MIRFVTTVLRDVPGCPNALIKEEVLSSAIEFCESSGIYTAKLTESVLKDAESLTITVPANTGLVEINNIVVDGIATYEIYADGTTIDFDGKAISDYDMDVYVSLKPLRSATELPDILYNDWYQTIAAGAKAKLMVMPEKPWTNPKFAGLHSGVFEDGAKSAMRKAFAKNMPTEKRISRRMGIWLI